MCNVGIPILLTILVQTETSVQVADPYSNHFYFVFSSFIIMYIKYCGLFVLHICFIVKYYFWVFFTLDSP